MQHGIRVDTIIRGVAPAHRVDASREVAHLMQDVVELQHHRQRSALQETLRNLRIPYQLVGVQRGITVSPPALVVHIGRETHAPRRIQVQRTSIAELPGVKVARLLQQVTRVVVAARTVERHLIPVLAHAQLQTFRNAAGVGGVTFRRGIPL